MSLMDALRRFFVRRVLPLTHEVLVSMDDEPYEVLHQYTSREEAMTEAGRFTRIANETGNGNLYMVREIQG